MDPHAALRQVVSQGSGSFQQGTWGAVLDLVGIPPQQEIVLIGDLHARLDNLHAILHHRNARGHTVQERVAECQAFLVFLGDIVHQDPFFAGHGSAEEVQRRLRDMSGSILIMQEIFELKRLYPHQVYCILGNHDYLSARFTKGGIHQGSEYRNALERQYGAEYLVAYETFLRQCPVLLIAQGLVAAHAGPALRIRSRDDVASIDPLREEHPLLEDLQWGRFGSTYTERDLRRFLKIIGQPRAYMIVGHSPALIPYGDFKTELCPRHYVVYSAADHCGYAVYRGQELEFIPVETHPGTGASCGG